MTEGPFAAGPCEPALERDAASLVLLLLRSFSAGPLEGRRTKHNSSSSGGGASASHTKHTVHPPPPPPPVAPTARALFLLRMVLSGGGTTFTERDLYYCCPALFGAQGQRGAHQSLNRLSQLLRLGALTAALDQHQQQHNRSILFNALANPAKACHEAERLLESQAAATCTAAAAVLVEYTREDLRVTAAPRSILVGPLAFTCGGGGGSRPIALRRRGKSGVLLGSDVALSCHDFRWDPAAAAAAGGVSKAEGDISSGGGGSGGGATVLGGASSSQPVLVFVEKECTLRRLLDALYPRLNEGDASASASSAAVPPAAADRFIFLCTKGYPCVASRQFLRRLHAEWPVLEMVALVDGDPHGLRILLTLMSPLAAARPQQRRWLSDHVDDEQGESPTAATHSSSSAPALLPVRWLGMKPSSIPRRPDTTTTTSGSGTRALSPLAPSDGAVLNGLRARLEAIVLDGSDPSAAAAVARNSARAMMAEAAWMATTQLKCELQAGDPLALLLAECPAG